jgi:hypothetical protein
MDTLPFRRNPADFPEEEKLLRRLYRLFAVFERLQRSLRRSEPATARDLRGVHGVLEYITVSIESSCHHPGRLLAWQEAETNAAKRPPASFALLLRLLAMTRKAACAVLRAHQEMQEDSCSCWICDDTELLRWFVGKTRRLLSAAQHAHR